LFKLAGLDPAHRPGYLGVAMHAASALAIVGIEGDVQQHDARAGGTMGGGKGRRVERQVFHRGGRSFIAKTNAETDLSSQDKFWQDKFWQDKFCIDKNHAVYTKRPVY
jgi:hypothetical protein